jgi:hypothetical protein
MSLQQTFVQSTERSFHFLESDFGFVRKTPDPPFVTYESDRLQLLVYYEAQRRHELDLRLRRLIDDPRKPLSLSIGMLMRLRDGPDSQGYMSRFPNTEEALEQEIENLAQL